MSSFIVEKETINRVVTTLRDRCAWLDDPTKLGQALWEMNFRAYAARYRDDAGLVAPYVFKEASVSLLQGYKSARCLLYQCAEGPVPEEELFQRVSEASRNMAEAIVQLLPEYDKADWG